MIKTGFKVIALALLISLLIRTKRKDALGKTSRRVFITAMPPVAINILVNSKIMISMGFVNIYGMKMEVVSKEYVKIMIFGAV